MPNVDLDNPDLYSRPEDPREVSCEQLIDYLRQSGSGTARLAKLEAWCSVNPSATALDLLRALPELLGQNQLGTLRKAHEWLHGEPWTDPRAVGQTAEEIIRGLRQQLETLQDHVRDRDQENTRLRMLLTSAGLDPRGQPGQDSVADAV